MIGMRRYLLDDPRKGFTLLLAAILLIFVVRPFLEGAVRMNLLMEVFFAVILVSALYALRQRTRTLIIALLLGFPAAVAFGLFHVVNHTHVIAGGLVFAILFLAFTIFIIGAYLFTEKEVTTEVIAGAVCVYFLLGTAWSLVYALLELLNPGSFSLPEGLSPDLSTFHYFSFTTITTMGYGDITPLSHKAFSLATLEAVTGQLYVAILVARLVGMHVSHSRSGS